MLVPIERTRRIDFLFAEVARDIEVERGVRVGRFNLQRHRQCGLGLTTQPETYTDCRNVDRIRIVETRIHRRWLAPFPASLPSVGSSLMATLVSSLSLLAENSSSATFIVSSPISQCAVNQFNPDNAAGRGRISGPGDRATSCQPALPSRGSYV